MRWLGFLGALAVAGCGSTGVEGHYRGVVEELRSEQAGETVASLTVDEDSPRVQTGAGGVGVPVTRLDPDALERAFRGIEQQAGDDDMEFERAMLFPGPYWDISVRDSSGSLRTVYAELDGGRLSSTRPP